jgi:hypothetical protein
MLLLHESNASNHSAAESAFVIDDSKLDGKPGAEPF